MRTHPAPADQPLEHQAPGTRGVAPRRAGFTLMELSLVLAIMVLMLGLAWPLLERPLAYERLRHAGEQVMAEWTTARVDAMRAGTEQKFTYQPRTGGYKLTSDPRSEDSQLPTGVIFVSSVKEADARESDDGSSGDAGAPEIWFYPDGTCSDVPELLLQNEYGMQIRLILRGLTGVTRIDDNVPDADGRLAGASP